MGLPNLGLRVGFTLHLGVPENESGWNWDVVAHLNSFLLEQYI